MTPPPSHDRLDADRDEQAALWAARASDAPLTPGEQSALAQWLAEDPANARRLDGYRRLSSVLDRSLPALVASGAVALPQPPAPAKRPRRWVLPALALGAAAAALAVWIGGRGRPLGSFATAADERRTFTLNDGSQIELNARSSVTVEALGSIRRVRLVGGEAFFIVAKDRTRPFIVDTSAGSVRVTGTKFDVCAERPAELDVTVLEGSVQVRPSSGPASLVSLVAGDCFSAENAAAGIRRLSSSELQDALAWRDGEVICDGMPLSELLDRLSRYYNCPIRVSADAADIPIGGTFPLGDLDRDLADLTDGFPIQVTRDAKGISVTKAAGSHL